jgi:hypothetical protein
VSGRCPALESRRSGGSDRFVSKSGRSGDRLFALSSVKQYSDRLKDEGLLFDGDLVELFLNNASGLDPY